MSAYDVFKVLLKEGQTVEDEAIKIICKRNNVKITIKQNNENYKNVLYDFQTDDKLKYEIKHDRQAPKTNNIFIENESFNKKSGIDITQADYYIIKVNKYFYMMDVITLKREMTKYRNIKIIHKEGNTAKGYLFPFNEFIKLSILLNP
jgi:hypothetical protein